MSPAGRECAKTKAPASAPREPRPAGPSPDPRATNPVWSRLALSGAHAKLAVGAPDDPLEREAERFAERATAQGGAGVADGAPVAGPVPPPVPALRRKCAACTEEEEELRRSPDPAGAAPTHGPNADPRPSAAPPAVADTLARPGGPLDAGSRAFFEPLLGLDLGGVRIHRGGEAARSARAVGARAYTVGQHIAFAAGQYDPDGGTGRSLLAHELAHVAQQGGAAPVEGPAPARQAAGPLVQRDFALVPAEGGESAAAGPAAVAGGVSMRVSLVAVYFALPPERRFAAGPKLPQALAIALRRLLGEGYAAGDEGQVLTHLQATVPGLYAVGLEGEARADETVGQFGIATPVAHAIVLWARGRNLELALTEAQLRLIRLGLFSHRVWLDLSSRRVQEAMGFALPDWFVPAHLSTLLARRPSALEAYADAATAWETDRSEANRTAVIGAFRTVLDALRPGIGVVESVRTDPALADHPAHQALFGAAAGDTPARPDAAGIALFLDFIASQPRISARAVTPEGGADRRELLDRYERFVSRALLAEGDQTLAEGGDAVPNTPAIPATLSGYPGIGPPLYDAAADTTYAFLMQLQFPDVLSAFASYAYRWERVRVPDERIGGAVDLDRTAGSSPGSGEVASSRFRRAGRYLLADVSRTIARFPLDLATPIGVTPTTLVAANGILRFLGTGISLAIDIAATPRYELHTVFPETGLYVVRCRAVPVVSGEEELVRVPSVAYLPVFVRTPAEIAGARLDLGEAGARRARDRIAEIEALLAEPQSRMDRPDLERELAALRASSGPVTTELEMQRAALREQLAGLTEGSPERRALERRIEELDTIIEHGAERVTEGPLANAERLPAVFVSDEGQVLNLALEVAHTGSTASGYTCYVSDLTTRRSGQQTATGPDRPGAIRTAVRALLEGPSGYGRGHCTLSIDGDRHELRIEASEGQIVMEAIENLATVASLAAIAAAPFTAGQSLHLLLAIGAIGMIPSAYRLASRVEAGTFEWDLETAMDVVNIVSGLVGLSHTAAGALRMVRLGRALMVLGIGADGLGVLMMGAALVEQIESTAELPPGQRAAQIMTIVGNAMVQAGIMIGAAVAARRYQSHVEGALAVDDPSLAPWREVRASEGVAIGGVVHGLSIGMQDGRLFVRMCTDCAQLARLLGRLLRFPSVRERPALVADIRTLRQTLIDLDAGINSGAIRPAEARRRLDGIKGDLRALAGAHGEVFASGMRSAAAPAAAPHPLDVADEPESPRQHERRNILEDIAARPEDPAHPHAFTLRDWVQRGDAHNSFRRIGQELTARRARILAETRVDPLPGLDLAVLDANAVDLVNAVPDLRARYLDLDSALNHPDSPVRRRPEYAALSPETLDRMRADLEAFDNLTRYKRPDIVDFDLLRGEIAVWDLTFEPNNPYHRFKTAFYAHVLERMTGLRASAADVTARRGGSLVSVPVRP